MKIALIGHGIMGQLIETLAVKKRHTIGAVIDHRQTSSSAESLATSLEGSDVAIDFTVAGAVLRNVEACMIAGVPLVEGTTGWNAERDEIEKIVRDAGGAML